jgi:putative heme iron utilization protein
MADGGERPASAVPTLAERARTLVHVGRQGALATVSRRRTGHPFASLIPYAPDEHGRPLVLASGLAVHTQNLAVDSRTSLLVVERGPEADALAAGRITLVGTGAPVEGGAVAAARAAYLARHPAAAAWADFGDFAFWRVEVEEAYLIAGFGAMGWIGGADYAAARVDPLADSAADIAEHMNRDHPDALLELARALADEPADAATMTSVDRLGFGLRLRAGDRESRTRIAFPREVGSPDETRAVLIEMLRDARRRPPA